MKIIQRIALLFVSIFILISLTYNEGVTICGTCRNLGNLFQDYCDGYACAYTIYREKRACCDPGYVPTTTCNTSSGSIAKESWSLTGNCIPGSESYQTCNNVTGCWQNPTWSYMAYDSCSMGTLQWYTTENQNLCS